jgi:hypothetical protein
MKNTTHLLLADTTVCRSAAKALGSVSGCVSMSRLTYCGSIACVTSTQVLSCDSIVIVGTPAMGHNEIREAELVRQIAITHPAIRLHLVSAKVTEAGTIVYSPGPVALRRLIAQPVLGEGDPTAHKTRLTLPPLAARSMFTHLEKALVHQVLKFLDVQKGSEPPGSQAVRAWQLWIRSVEYDFVPQIRLFVPNNAERALLDTLVEDIMSLCRAVNNAVRHCRVGATGVSDEHTNCVLMALQKLVRNRLLESVTTPVVREEKWTFPS